MPDATTYAGTISKIKVSDGNIYQIADKWARDQIAAITGGSAIVFKGVSSTPLTDGGNENPTVGGSVVTSKTIGDLYFVGNDEYIYGADQKWHWLGSQLGQLGALAYKDSAKGAYTPAGTVSQPTFSGTASTVSISYTPAGTVTKPTFSGTATTLKGGVTPGGTVSQPTFSGTASTVSISYTPAGTISKPNITVTTGTKAINYVTGVGSVPTWSSEVEDETLMFSFTQGAVPSTASINATTSVSASLAASPTFSGTAATLKGGYTPAGTVSQPSFNGTATTVSISYTPAGTVSQPTFSGTAATLKGGYTPAGTVSQPTFNGTASTVTVS